MKLDKSRQLLYHKDYKERWRFKHEEKVIGSIAGIGNGIISDGLRRYRFGSRRQ